MMQNGNSQNESTVTYTENNEVRTLRGIVTEDGEWIIVKRRDGTVKFNKKVVIKIEDRPGEVGK